MGRALNLLGYRARSEAEIRDRLARYGYVGETIEAVILRLEELGYLDDVEFARTKAREKARRYGPRRVSVELRKSGVGESWRGRSSKRSSRVAPRWGRLDPPPRGGIMGVDPTQKRVGSTAFWFAGVTRRRYVPRSPGSTGSLRKPRDSRASLMPGRRSRGRPAGRTTRECFVTGPGPGRRPRRRRRPGILCLQVTCGYPPGPGQGRRKVHTRGCRTRGRDQTPRG